MDPVTHSLAGAALSRAGLHRTTPLATATLIIAANAPDVDVLAYVNGTYGSLALRRGITHGPMAMLLLPLLVAGAVLAWDRWWRRRKRGEAPPARPGAIVALAFLGVLTHSPLDWLNTYGIRLLMPFSDRWFYGDSLFIIDPWLWLVLGAALVGVYTRTRRGMVLWSVLGAAASALVLAGPGVPLAAQVVWVAAMFALVASVVVSRRRGTGPDLRAARVALAVAASYILVMIGADALATRAVRAAASAAGIEVHDLMVAPVPANPLAGEIVVDDAAAYHLGTFHWLSRPRVRWTGRRIDKGERTPAVLATLQLSEVRDYLRWSRFPFVEVSDAGDRYIVRFGDARYPDQMRGGLGGITVEVARPDN